MFIGGRFSVMPSYNVTKFKAHILPKDDFLYLAQRNRTFELVCVWGYFLFPYLRTALIPGSVVLNAILALSSAHSSQSLVT